ncbi:MAG: alpha-ketoglutarate-dependent dioxygenase AlkB [Jatrophihabitantaceae bacterium]
MLAGLQGSLLDDLVGDVGDESGTRFGPLASSVSRQQLSDGAWVDLCPGWLSGADGLFERLLGSVGWRAERRQMYDRIVDVPRLTCFYDERAELPDPALTQAKQALNERYQAELGEPFRTAGLCLYRDGRDSVAWHGDDLGRGRTEDTMVAILSLGSARPLLLRPRAGGASSVRYSVGHGDLLVMGGSCQRTWQHAIGKTSRPVGPRISVQFRPRGVR